MAQITSGVRAIFSSPHIYSLFQAVMGGDRFRRDFVAHFARPFPGMRILDIGCGPADILAYLDEVVYFGFDISDAYIDQARKRFGQRGNFFRKQLERGDLDGLPPFDLVFGLGLLHHLDDDVAADVMGLAFQALGEGGRFLTVDPCLDSSQNAVARYLVSSDRGRNVRDRDGYERLARGTFRYVRAEVRHQAWIPYTHCLMECRK